MRTVTGDGTSLLVRVAPVGAPGAERRRDGRVPGGVGTFSTFSPEAILLLRENGFAGATVGSGIAGFGSSARIRTKKVLRRSLDLPSEAVKA